MKTTSIVAGLLFVLVHSLPAQESSQTTPKPGDLAVGEGGHNSAVWLLIYPGVRQDLKIRDAVWSQVQEIHDQFRNDLFEETANTRGLEGAELAEVQKSNAKIEKRLAIAASRRLIDVLSEQQSKRLDEIYVQLLDIAAIVDPAVAARLGVTAQQQQQYAEIAKTAQQELQEISQRYVTGELNDEQVNRVMKERQDKMRLDLVNVLTQQQQAHWKKLQGTEKFRTVGPEVRGIQ